MIVGGESGPGARPMHPDWAREIRDACFYENLQRDPNGLDHAGPAFFFKQWGEWLPYEPDDAPFWTGHDGHIIDGHALPYLSEHDVVDGWWWPDPESAPIYRKLGKKRAGRLLDGREWSEFPVVDVVEGHRYEGTRA